MLNKPFTYAQAKQFAKWLHWAIYFRDEAKRHAERGDAEWARMARGMMRSNAMNAMWLAKADRVGGFVL